MRKVTCTQCGLVNLERFVTFPHCAGCGTRLPEGAVAPQSYWAKPLRAPFWATIVGLGCVALAVGVVSMSRETSRPEDGRMVVYTQVPRTVTVHSMVETKFQLDAATVVAPAQFREVRLRLSRPIIEAFDVVMVQPEPGTVFSTNGGRYFLWTQLEREVPVHVTLRAKRPGEFRFNAQIYAQDFSPFECRNFIRVRPTVSQPKTKGTSNAKQ